MHLHGRAFKRQVMNSMSLQIIVNEGCPDQFFLALSI